MESPLRCGSRRKEKRMNPHASALGKMRRGCVETRTERKKAASRRNLDKARVTLAALRAEAKANGTTYRKPL